MAYLLKQVKIINSASTHHLAIRDVLIDKGIIQKISKSIAPENHHIFEAKKLILSTGFVDMNCHIYQPGYEYREEMETGLSAAANGGYTTLALMPNTNPVVDTKGQVAYIKSLAKKNLVDVVPIGAVSKHCEGKDLAEIYDMHSEGVSLFSDGYQSIQNPGMLERALLYVKKFDGVVMNHCDVKNISNGGLMNEGVLSTKLGLHASPKLAEDLMVARDIFLASHCDSRLHFVNVSTANAVKQIKEAKKKGLKITASVNAYNLLLEDSYLNEYDTNYKVNPHLRTKDDIKALLKGLKEGTIDYISSGHNPKHNDEKKVEFENAEFGISALDTAFSVARTATQKVLSAEELVSKFTSARTTLLGQDKNVIEEGQNANLVLFNADEDIVYTLNMLKSKSKNTPFLDLKLKGKIYATFNNKKQFVR